MLYNKLDNKQPVLRIVKPTSTTVVPIVLAIRTTVVPIILAIRTTVVPIILAIRTTVDRTMPGQSENSNWYLLICYTRL